jgi:hypothetical protein
VTLRSKRLFSILGFHSTHDALSAEALLEDLGIEVTPIPAPPSLSATCGIALRIEVFDTRLALTYLDRAEIRVARHEQIEDV